MKRLTFGMLTAPACITFVTMLTACGSSGTASIVDSNETTPVAVQPSEPVVDTATSTPCILSTQEVGQAFARFIPGGDVAITFQKSSKSGVCEYTFPPGFRTPSDNGPNIMNGADAASITLTRYSYASGQYIESGVYDVDRSYGGSTSTEVYESSYTAIHDVDAATGWGLETLRYPNIGDGLVSDGQSEFVLAGTGLYWYEMGMGGLKGSAAYNPALVQLASRLAALG